LPVADRVDPDVKPVQPSGRNTPADGAASKTQRHQLTLRHDPVLSISSLRDPRFTLAS
jgi:hypothetical protein